MRSLLSGMALVAALTSAQATAQPAKQAVVPKGMEWATDVLHFSPALRSGELLYVSGVGAGLRRDETEADKEAAIDRAFQKSGRPCQQRARVGTMLFKSRATTRISRLARNPPINRPSSGA